MGAASALSFAYKFVYQAAFGTVGAEHEMCSVLVGQVAPPLLVNAEEIAQKASAAQGPTVVLIPLRGVSAIDREGQPFWWPEADQALFQSLRNWMSPHVQRIELDLHINDPAFAEAAANTLLGMLTRR